MTNNTPDAREKLLPCPVPWCHGEPSQFSEGGYWHVPQPIEGVRCTKCGATAESPEQWNTRATAHPEPTADAPGEEDEEWLRGDWYEKWQDATENANCELLATLEALRGRVERTILAALRTQSPDAVALLRGLADEMRAEEDCNTGQYDEWLARIDKFLQSEDA